MTPDAGVRIGVFSLPGNRRFETGLDLTPFVRYGKIPGGGEIRIWSNTGDER
jgi:hypothetical protein